MLAIAIIIYVLVGTTTYGAAVVRDDDDGLGWDNWEWMLMIMAWPSLVSLWLIYEKCFNDEPLE